MTPRKRPEDLLKEGRKTLYRPEYCQAVMDMGDMGKSITQFAASLSVSRETLYEWARVHPEFSDALRTAKQKSEAYLEELGMENLFSKDFNTRIWETFLKCRHNWRDRDKSENIVNVVKHEDMLKILKKSD